MSKRVMLYWTSFDKTQFLEISRCWRELRALPAQLDIPANHRPLLGKSWRGGRKSRHGLRTAFHTVTTTEDDFSLYFLSNGTPANSLVMILLDSEKNIHWIQEILHIRASKMANSKEKMKLYWVLPARMALTSHLMWCKSHMWRKSHMWCNSHMCVVDKAIFVKAKISLKHPKDEAQSWLVRTQKHPLLPVAS